MSDKLAWSMVESSHVLALGYIIIDNFWESGRYRADQRSTPVVQLYVAYKDGGVYQFPRITYETYERLVRAESVGKALHLLFPGENYGERVEDVSELLKEKD